MYAPMWLFHYFTASRIEGLGFREQSRMVTYIDLWWRQQLRDGPIQQGVQQSVTQDLSQVLGHDCLLLHPTVILNGKDDGEVWCLSEKKQKFHNKPSYRFSFQTFRGKCWME